VSSADGWVEPDAAEAACDVPRQDTIPCPPPLDVVPGPSRAIDLTVTPGILSAIRSAERLTAASQHAEALDDLRRAASLLRAECLRLDPAEPLFLPLPREVASLDWRQADKDEHHAVIERLAAGRPLRSVTTSMTIKRVERGPGWSYRGHGGGGIQVFEHSREVCDTLERISGVKP
jgi:hypothetical protein